MSIVIDDGFRPPWWLRGGHRQSILVGLPLRKAALSRRTLPVRSSAREWLLDCGDGVRLQAWHSSPTRRGRHSDGPVVVLLHGWEGSADSGYVVSAAQSLYEAGFDVVRLNFRDHGATHHLNEELFHSCRLPEVVGAVRAVQAALPGRVLHLAGFSLGGNFALRVAAVARAESLTLARTFAVSPLLDPQRTLRQLVAGSLVYHGYFRIKYSRSLLRKQAAWPQRYEFRQVLRGRDLWRITDDLVREFTDYPDIDTYLAGYSLTGDRLATLVTPATILTSRDDPIISSHDLDRLAFSGMLRVRLTDTGGHCGYLQSLTGPSWVERVMLEEFARC